MHGQREREIGPGVGSPHDGAQALQRFGVPGQQVLDRRLGAEGAEER